MPIQPLQIRVAIALHCGWDHYETVCGIPFYYKAPAMHPVPAEELPDYLNDLNAMRDAERRLGFNRLDYDQALTEICKRPEGAGFGHNPIHATAAQRAEAFRLTLNLTSP